LDLVTFLTFTAKPEDREEIADGGLVLGTEMRRTMNAMQQRFRREGYGEFAYVWVAENPKDENPHVHMLTNHRVPRAEFGALASWIEGLWGHGWVKIERVRKPASAGHYILKAVGYSLKGTEANQGRVRGNRYGISRNIRPVYETYGYLDADAERAALLDLMCALPDGVEIEPLGRLWLTRSGMAFPAGSTLDEVEATLDVLGSSG
jgi:hypothetical protein